MTYVSLDTKKAVEARLGEVLLLAQCAYPAKMATFEVPTVDYLLNGTVAGTANYHSNHISLNSVLLNQNTKEFIHQTVGHEFCHIVTDHVFPNACQYHGLEWKRVMRSVGLLPTRCHNYATEDSATKQKQKFQYKCTCRSSIIVSSVLHNRMTRKGQRYSCTSCGAALTLVTGLGQVSYRTARDQVAANAAKENK